MATKVKLRQKAISNGRKSLYLDLYPPILNLETGKPTRRDFLGLYIFAKPKSTLEKQHNNDTIKIGESIRQQRENFLNKPEIYNQYEKEQLRLKEMGESCFVKYFKELTEKRKGSNYFNWISACKYLESFTGGNLKFENLTERKVEDFKEYLLSTESNRSIGKKLSRNSAASYFLKIKAALNQAYKDGFLHSDLTAKIKPIKPEETRREYLTIVELNKLIKTPCNNELLKRAALFSALTGLRFSDIAKLTWKELIFVDGQGFILNFRQQKTKGLESHYISDQAAELLGKRLETNTKVFNGLKYSAYQNKHLYQWIGAAGITKDITFHCFRHTYATLQLMQGSDIYLVSKLLGHKDLKTTQVYAKVVDEAKRKAAGAISLDL